MFQLFYNMLMIMICVKFYLYQSVYAMYTNLCMVSVCNVNKYIYAWFGGSRDREMCEMKYGHAPEVRTNGHLNATFPYMSPPLEYIILELLKNAMRSTFATLIYLVYSVNT